MNYKDYNDYELIYMVRENGDTYKNILYEKYRPIINKIASEFYNKYKEYGYDLDDFIQEAMITFDKAILSYDDDSSLFYSYVTLCMRRRLSSFTRDISRVKKGFPLSSYVELEDFNTPDLTSDLELIFRNKEIQDILKSVIYDCYISIEETSIFELRLNGFTYREIGILLDIPSSSVEFRTRKVRNKLRNSLSEYYCK